jgi:serine/threonine-protein kinase
MGEVYRARDPRLGREVAIKVLPDEVSADRERLSRFEQEARAASALNHPNILAIFDIGTQSDVPYVVSELLEGETLRDRLAGAPLPARKATDYAIQIAEGLAAAQERGIVHRDLKPENLFVTADGRIKILDFGLAKVTRPDAPGVPRPEAPTIATETRPGVVMGTLGYMSPEQVRGQPADPRSDIFAFGAVLYEMLTGHRAFRRATAADTMSAILKEEPEFAPAHPGVPPPLEHIVLRCLEKSPKERFQSARDLAFALRQSSSASAAPQSVSSPAPRSRLILWLALGGLVVLLATLFAVNAGRIRGRLPVASGPARIRSLAVLPLENLSRDPEQEYFADGMTDELIADISQIGALRVISRTSVMEYKGAKKPLPEIARALNVDAMVEGSVLRSGDRVRITAQLIDAKSDRHLWAKSYERDMKEVLALQSEVARAIAGEIRVKITPQEQARLTTARPIEPEALEAYLLGRHHLDAGSPEGLPKALRYFQLALEKEPRYALAYTGIADYYSILSFYSRLSPKEAFPQAKAAVMKALEIDENLAEGHSSLAYVLAYYDWDWSGAEREFKRALELNPSYASGHHSYSRYLAARGRLEEATTEIERAQELDPLAPWLKANKAMLAYFGGDYGQAIKELNVTLELSPDFAVAIWGLGLAYEQEGKYEEALAALQKTTTLSPSLNFKASLGHAYGAAGKKREARAVLDALMEQAKQRYVPSYYFALTHAGLGEKDRAFEWLEKACAERSTLLAYLKMDPRLAGLRSDPRFGDLFAARRPLAVKSTSRRTMEARGGGSGVPLLVDRDRDVSLRRPFPLFRERRRAEAGT